MKNPFKSRKKPKPQKQPSQTEQAKYQYSQEFIQLQGIINLYDPACLIAYGCPEDEYNAEIAAIIQSLTPDMAQKQIHKLLTDTFGQFLGSSAKIDENSKTYKKLAKAIKKWNSRREIVKSFRTEVNHFTKYQKPGIYTIEI